MIIKNYIIIFLSILILAGCNQRQTLPPTALAEDLPVPTETNQIEPSPVPTGTETLVPTPTEKGTDSPTAPPTETKQPTATSLPRVPFDGVGTIAYISNPGDSTAVMEIYLMDVATRESQQLTNLNALSAAPAWSPDGTQIVFMSRPDFDSPHEIYSVQVSSGMVRQLTNDPADDQTPAWSPDGNKIVFSSDRDGDYDLYLMDSDGSNVQPLTDNDWNDKNPDWSPDGQRITFESDQYRNSQIFVLTVAHQLEDPTNMFQRITDNEFNDYAPAWSPDGRLLAFHSIRSGPPEIYLMDADGLEQRQMTFLERNAWWADWSTDGQWILFSFFNNRDEFAALHELYVVHVQGSIPIRLTNSPSDDWYPAWTNIEQNP